MIGTSPLSFQPWMRKMPWGGKQLTALYGFNSSPSPVGEAWLLSDHHLHHSKSTVSHVDHLTLRQLIQHHGRDLVGQEFSLPFPILIKILDAAENLSIQVHPDDDQSRLWSPGERGKSEAWVVLSVEKNAALYIDLKQDCSMEQFEASVRRGKTVECLNRIEPRVGEVYAIPPGTVHAIGAGIMLLEVQQSSDATFRLDDWGRTEADGKSRPLHVEAGLACARKSPRGVGLQSATSEPSGAKLLVQNSHFSIRQWSDCSQVVIHAPAIVIPWQSDIICMETDSPYHRGNATVIPALMKQCTFELQPTAVLYEIRWHLS